MRSLSRSFSKFPLLLLSTACILAISCSSGKGSKGSAPPPQVSPLERTVGVLPGYENRSPENGGSFSRSLPTDVVTLNPVVANDITSYLVYKWIFDPLVDMDQDVKPVGVLAKSWENSPDNKVTTFHLREGVTWHDGKPFTAEDVLFSYEAAMDPDVDAINKRPAFAKVAKVVKVDDLTVRVTWKEPYSPGFGAWVFYIMPKHVYQYAKGKGEEFNKNPKNSVPVGTGPFKFQEWKRGEKVVLKANEGYFRGRPHLDEMVFKIIPQGQTQMAAYKTGQLDLMTITPDLWKQLKNDQGYMNSTWVFEYGARQFLYIGWNMDGSNPFFSDKRVRQAMTLALNRQGIVDKALDGHGVLASGPFYYQSWDCNPGIKPMPHDPAKASALLDEAGWKDSDNNGVRDKGGKPFSFECLLPAGQDQLSQFLEFFQQDLKKIGVDLQIRKLEWSVFLDRTHRHQFAAYLSGWSLQDDPDPFQLLHSSQAKLMADGTGTGQNDFSYRNEEVDRLIEAEQKTFNLEERKKIFWKMHELVADDQPMTFLFWQTNMAGVRNSFQNVRVSRAGYGLFFWYPSALDWWYAKDAQKK